MSELNEMEAEYNPLKRADPKVEGMDEEDKVEDRNQGSDIETQETMQSDFFMDQSPSSKTNSDTSRGVSKPKASKSDVYLSVYNGVTVYEMFINGYGVMRRARDDYVNATHLLTIAGLSKGQRTKFLDNYTASKANYERIQGGYGRYQGTWIPIDEAVSVAKRYDIESSLSDLFKATMGSISKTPLSKKLYTAKNPVSAKKSEKSNKEEKGGKEEKNELQSPSKKKTRTQASQGEDFKLIHAHEMLDCDYRRVRDFKAAPAAEIPVWDKKATLPIYRSLSELIPTGATELMTKSNVAWIDEQVRLLDQLPYTERLSKVVRNIYEDGEERELYALMSHRTEGSTRLSFNVDMILDDLEHTVLHWAATMASMKKVYWLLKHGADATLVDRNGASILMRCVSTSHHADRQSFHTVLELFSDSAFTSDYHGRTLLHHIVLSYNDLHSAASDYYLGTFLDFLNQPENEHWMQMYFAAQDKDGNTVLHLAYQYHRTTVVHKLLLLNVDTEVCNQQGKVPSEMSF